MRYDAIGVGYASTRRPDPRWAAAIDAAVGPGRLVNVGAGAGSYEPARPGVVAVEPSRVMLAQRPAGAAPAVQAGAEALPFAARAFDVALAVLTVHHWPRQGLTELRRVAQRVVVVTWDPAHPGFWLTREYFPELLAIDRAIFPRLPTLEAALGPLSATPLLVPRDCVDGFLGAFWARPAAYLDPAVRAGMSTFARIDARAGLERLREDVTSGAWAARHDPGAGDALDLGYRVVATISG